MNEAHPLRPFLYPRGVAIIGASASPLKHGGRRWLSSLAAAGVARVFPVNSRGGTLNGHEVAKDVRELPADIDLAIVLVPAAAVPGVLEQCASHDIGRAVIVSGGFGEMGPEGLETEKLLVASFRASGGRILGPNCAGIFSAYGGVNALGWDVPKGNIGVITQSGNVALTLARYAREKRTGFSTIIPLGNAADVRLSELVELLVSDQNTHSILIYCEGFSVGDGRRLVEIARKSEKRIVMLKPGGSEAGRRAVQSHTASIAGDELVIDAALEEAGIVRARELEEAFDIAMAFATHRQLRGRDIAVLSDGGGHATIVADFAGRLGLGLSTFTPATATQLRQALPPLCGVANPIDFAGTAEPNPKLVAEALKLCAADPNVHGVIFAGLFGGYHVLTQDDTVASAEANVAREIVAIAQSTPKPVLVHTEYANSDLATLQPFRDAGMPLYVTLESSAKAMRALLAKTASGGLAGASAVNTSAPIAAHAAHAPMLEPEARERLRVLGVDVPPWAVVSSQDDACNALARFNSPIAMKLISDRALHKSDLGGVILGIATREACAQAYAKLSELGKKLGDASSRVLLAAMIAGVETFIGVKRDPYFGPVVAFGGGGVLVELATDVSCKLAPFDERAAHELIGRTRASKLLEGYRGGPRLDVAALARLLARISQVVAAPGAPAELDLNPVVVNGSGAHIVDVRWIQ